MSSSRMRKENSLDCDRQASFASLGIPTEMLHCPLCGEELMRKRRWKPGERLARGHDPKRFKYFECRRCDRVWMQVS